MISVRSLQRSEGDEGIMISVKSLQRSEGDVSDPVYIYS